MRGIDLRLPSNRFAVSVSAAAGALAAAVSDDPLPGRARDGVVVAAAAFLAWALARELDPDRTVTAGVACVAGAVVGLVLPVSVGAVYLLVVAARILSGSTGLAPTPADVLLNLAVAAWVARAPAGWVAGMALAVALVRDVGLPDRAPPSQLWWGGLAGAVVSVVAGTSARLGEWREPVALEWLVLAAGVVGLGSALRPDRPTSTADLTSAPLHPARLGWARGLTGAALVLAALVSGGFGVAATAPAWVAMAAAGLGRLAR